MKKTKFHDKDNKKINKQLKICGCFLDIGVCSCEDDTLDDYNDDLLNN